MAHPSDPRSALPALLAKPAAEAEASLSAHLRKHSRLPGPRGNLELAAAFVEGVGTEVDALPERTEGWWRLCLRWSQLGLDQAPVNDPNEFLVFCAAAALPVFAPAKGTEAVWAQLRRLAGDPRWRTREAVAMAIQAMAKQDSRHALRELKQWASTHDEWLVLRAVAGGVAEPSLLVSKEFARAALALHRTLFARLTSAKERKSPEYASFRQGLGYSLSVVVAALPESGWAMIEGLAESDDADVRWVLRENLKKKRLVATDPKRCANLLKALAKRPAEKPAR